METYKIYNNDKKPFKVNVDRNNNIAYVFNKQNNKFAEYHILEYKFKDIFLGKELEAREYDGNTIIIHLDYNIYVFIGPKIFVFESLYPITDFFSPIGNSNVPSPFAIDQMGNCYLMLQYIVISNVSNKFIYDDPYDYYYNNTTIKSFEYENNIYDINGWMFYGDNRFYFSHHIMPEKHWDIEMTEYSRIGYLDSNNDYHSLDKESYCKINNDYSKYMNFSTFNKTFILKKSHIKEYNNIIPKLDRASKIQMYMYIKKYLNDNKIIIDKNIIKLIISSYGQYLDSLNVLSQCAQSINHINNINNEMYVYAANKYGKVLKYLDIGGFDNDFIKMAIKNNPSAIKYVDNQTEELSVLATSIMGSVIKHIKDKTYNVCKSALEQDPYVLKIIGNTYDDLTMNVLSRKGWLLQYINNQTRELCLVAVKQCGDALEYVKEQTEEICICAIKQNANAINWVKEHTDAIYNCAILSGCCLSLVDNYTLETAIESINYNGNNLRYIDEEHITQELCNNAVFNGKLVKFSLIPKQFRTDILCKHIIKSYPWSMTDWSSGPKKYWKYVLKQDGILLKYLIYKTYDLCLIAVLNNPFAIAFVPYEPLMMDIYRIALTANIKCLKHIQDHTNELYELALSINPKAEKYIFIV